MISKVKLTTGFVTAAFLAAIVLPGGAQAATVKIKKNGADSTNKVKIKSETKSKVSQSNSSVVMNMVGVMQNTGGNSANKNNGGDVTVNSGNATASVTNTTTTGGNMAHVENCGCPDDLGKVVIKNNGADSKNSVNVNSTSTFKVTQSNETLVVNGVVVAQNTGMNEANKNNGEDAMVSVDSGDASATVRNTVTTGGNELQPTL